VAIKRITLTQEQEDGLARRKKQGCVVTRSWITPLGWILVDLVNNNTGATQRLYWKNKWIRT